ncbi:phosphoribosylformylglycinamidine cyclo-ligase [Alphaproteobacteria bacterium]|nr:phosphoribosylformylglycinamidine cyclo-ligase [Alphaproteobacteria bacterium]
MKKKKLNQNLDSINYSDAGVNIDLGEELVSEISPIAKATSIKGTIGDIGGFGGLFDLKKSGFKDPILVSSTDGVGTKLQLAIKTKSYFNIGIDLVAMCANDVLAQGAIPLFFMDYFATGKLKKDIAIEVIKGIAEGCKQSGCALIGGETAEMPGHYQNDSFDLAGFCVGAVERENLLNKNSVEHGDKVIAVASSGIHSNGYSLVRKIIETKSIDISKKTAFDNTKSLAELLMVPTLLYTKAFLAANKNLKVKSLSHITGGGLIENPPRAFNKNLTLQFNMSNFHLPPLFKWLQNQANISLFELTRTFNCGIGLLIFVDQKDVETILKDINNTGYQGFLIGSMIENKFNKNVIFDGWEL